MTTIGVHITHCCKTHGCKYGDGGCPVVSGKHEQEYPCEDCDTSTFEYVKIINTGCEGWINLFYRGRIIAMISDVDLAADMMRNMPEKTKQ